MIALIDTIFGPVLSWLNQIQSVLRSASVPASQGIPIQTLFAPLAMISPMWALLISNVFVMAAIYIIVFLVSNGEALYTRFKTAIKWW